MCALGMEEPFIQVSRYARPDLDTFVLRGHADTIEDLAFAPDANTLISGSKDGTVEHWDLRGRQLALRRRSFRSDVGTSAVSGDGKLIALGMTSANIDLLDFETLESVRTIPLDNKRAFLFAFSPDSQTLAALMSDRTVRLFALSKAGVEGEIPMPAGFDSDVMSFSPDGQLLAGTNGSDLIVIDVNRRAVLRTQPFADRLGAVEFLNSDTLLATCYDRTLHIVSARARDARSDESFAVIGAEPRSVAISPDGEYAAVRVQRAVEIFDLQTHRAVASLPHTGDIGRVKFLAGGRTLLTDENKAGPYLWNTKTWQRVGSLRKFGVASSFSASADGYRLVSIGLDGIVAIDVHPDDELNSDEPSN